MWKDIEYSKSWKSKRKERAFINTDHILSIQYSDAKTGDDCALMHAGLPQPAFISPDDAQLLMASLIEGGQIDAAIKRLSRAIEESNRSSRGMLGMATRGKVSEQHDELPQ